MAKTLKTGHFGYLTSLNSIDNQAVKLFPITLLIMGSLVRAQSEEQQQKAIQSEWLFLPLSTVLFQNEATNLFNSSMIK